MTAPVPELCDVGVYLKHPDPASGFHVSCEDMGVAFYDNILSKGGRLWLCQRHETAFLDIVGKAYGL